MRIFRCDTCAMAFDHQSFVPNKIFFLEDSSDPRFRDEEPSQWEKTKCLGHLHLDNIELNTIFVQIVLEALETF